MPELVEGTSNYSVPDYLRCESCDGAGKVIISASAARPHLYPAEACAGIYLIVCMDCGKLWVLPPYDRYASNVYLIAWPYSRAAWNSALARLGDSVIEGWCSHEIRRAWPVMSIEERFAVQNLRIQGQLQNFLDERPSNEGHDRLEQFLSQFDDSELGG